MIPPHCYQHWPSLSCLTVFQFNNCCDLTFLCFPPVSIFSSKCHPFNTAFRWGCSVTSLCLGSHICLYHLLNWWFFLIDFQTKYPWFWGSPPVPAHFLVSPSECDRFKSLIIFMLTSFLKMYFYLSGGWMWCVYMWLVWVSSEVVRWWQIPAEVVNCPRYWEKQVLHYEIPRFIVVIFFLWIISLFIKY